MDQEYGSDESVIKWSLNIVNSHSCFAFLQYSELRTEMTIYNVYK